MTSNPKKTPHVKKKKRDVAKVASECKLAEGGKAKSPEVGEKQTSEVKKNINAWEKLSKTVTAEARS